MGNKLTLDDVQNLQNESSVVTTLAQNNRAIEAAIENSVSRDGLAPNYMQNNLDMNSKRILNLPVPQSAAEPLRLADVVSGGVVINALPTGGTSGQVLTKISAADYDANWQTNIHVSPATATPLMDGVGAVGTSANYAREDHVHPSDTSRAPVASPTFTGTPAAPTASAGTSTTQIATTAFVTSAVREKLSAGRTYYVRTDGSDSNTGLANTAGGAFLTIQKAYNVITNNLDLGGQTVTISLGSGTFTGLSITSAWSGGGNVILEGNSVATVQAPAAGNAIYCSAILPGVFTAQNLTLNTATNAGSLIVHQGTGVMNIGDVTLNGGTNSGYDMISAFAGAYLHFVGNITMGTCSDWREIFYVRIGGIIDLYGSFGQNMTMTGNMSWTDSFVYVDPGSAFLAVAGARTINLGGFTMTGKKFTVGAGSILSSNGGGLSYLPGSTAGTPASVTTTGFYS